MHQPQRRFGAFYVLLLAQCIVAPVLCVMNTQTESAQKKIEKMKISIVKILPSNVNRWTPYAT